MHTLLKTAVLMVAGTIAAFADPSAILTGFITDPAGQPVSGTRVVIINLATNITSSVTSNGVGLYTSPPLEPGLYRMAITKDGFKTIVKSGIELHVQDTISVNFSLEIGSVSESVTVESGATAINTTDASVSTVIDRQFVENMPLNGRSLQSLIALTPGVITAPSAENAEQGQLSVAGQRAGSNYFSIDGVSANFAAAQTRFSGEANNGALLAFSALGSTSSLVSVDALQEFRLETSTYSPEFGRMSGAQALLLTRSGTNRFHGTAFDYFRNNALDANDWFADSTGSSKPAERQNDFGGTAGGPILKDRTFFFFSYEGLRVVQPQFLIVDVPSLAARASAAPNVRALVAAFPLPNGPNTGVDLSQLAASSSNRGGLDATSLRIDHSAGAKVSLFGRYNYSPSNLRTNCNYGPNVTCHKETTIHTGTFGVTATLTPRIINEFRFNYSRATALSNRFTGNSYGAVDPPNSALFPSFADPTIDSAGFQILTGRQLGIYNGQYTNHVNRQSNFVDSTTFTTGSHSIKFGFDFRHLNPQGGQAPITAYSFWSYNGNPMPAFISGQSPDYTAIAQSLNPPDQLFLNFAAYAQDVWKASRRLTVTYGLRWDYNPPPRDSHGNTYAFDQLNNLAAATLLPRGSELWHGSWSNFAPRLGVAYSLNPNSTHPTVVRIGAGQFYDLGTATAGGLDNGQGWYPYSLVTVLCNYGAAPGCNGGYPYSGALPPGVYRQPYAFMRAFDPHLKLPYSVQWSAAVEQTLSSSQSIKVTYLGSAGLNLLRDEIANNPNPIVKTLQITRNTGYSNYNSLQMEFQRRLSRGLQALVSYSWSHSLDTNSTDVTTAATNAILPIPFDSIPSNYASSDFDIRQTFTSAVTYSVPTVRTQNWLVRSLLRDWSLDSITSARTGSPYTVTYNLPGSYRLTDSQGNAFALRPDQVAGVPAYIKDPNSPGGKRLNPAAFAIPPDRRQGSEARNAIRGFPLFETDLAIRRTFPLREQIKLQFGAEVFNLINHPNFGNPLSNIGTCALGVTCKPIYGWGTSQSMLNQSFGSSFYGSGFGSLYQIGGPRSIQLSLKLQF